MRPSSRIFPRGWHHISGISEPTGCQLQSTASTWRFWRWPTVTSRYKLATMIVQHPILCVPALQSMPSVISLRQKLSELRQRRYRVAHRTLSDDVAQCALCSDRCRVSDPGNVRRCVVQSGWSSGWNQYRARLPSRRRRQHRLGIGSAPGCCDQSRRSHSTTALPWMTGHPSWGQTPVSKTCVTGLTRR